MLRKTKSSARIKHKPKYPFVKVANSDQDGTPNSYVAIVKKSQSDTFERLDKKKLKKSKTFNIKYYQNDHDKCQKAAAKWFRETLTKKDKETLDDKYPHSQRFYEYQIEKKENEDIFKEYDISPPNPKCSRIKYRTRSVNSRSANRTHHGYCGVLNRSYSNDEKKVTIFRNFMEYYNSREFDFKQCENDVYQELYSKANEKGKAFLECSKKIPKYISQFQDNGLDVKIPNHTYSGVNFLKDQRFNKIKGYRAVAIHNHVRKQLDFTFSSYTNQSGKINYEKCYEDAKAWHKKTKKSIKKSKNKQLSSSRKNENGNNSNSNYSSDQSEEDDNIQPKNNIKKASISNPLQIDFFKLNNINLNFLNDQPSAIPHATHHSHTPRVHSSINSTVQIQCADIPDTTKKRYQSMIQKTNKYRIDIDDNVISLLNEEKFTQDKSKKSDAISLKNNSLDNEHSLAERISSPYVSDDQGKSDYDYSPSSIESDKNKRPSLQETTEKTKLLDFSGLKTLFQNQVYTSTEHIRQTAIRKNNNLSFAIDVSSHSQEMDLIRHCDGNGNGNGNGNEINEIVNLNEEVFEIEEPNGETECENIPDEQDETADDLISIASYPINNTGIDSSSESLSLTHGQEILVISLFGGTGLIEDAFRTINSNCKVILYVEKNKNAQKIFFKNFDPDHNKIRHIEDINDLNPEEIAQWVIEKYPYNDLIFINAGFPCTTFSLAGKKQGLNDPATWKMFKKMVDLLKALDQKGKKIIFLMENVAGLAKYNFNRASFKMVKKELSCNNCFQLSYITLNSINFKLPQLRDRLYFTATNLLFPIIIQNVKKYGELPALKNIINFNDKELYKKHPLHSITQEALQNYSKLKNREKILLKTQREKKSTLYQFQLRLPRVGDADNLFCNNTCGTKRYSALYSSFNPQNPLTTLTAKVAPYVSFYEEDDNRLVFYGRKFSVRELARVQGVKECFDLCEGSLSKNIIAQLLGNAVALPVLQYVFTCMMRCYFQSSNPYYSMRNPNSFFLNAPSLINQNKNNHYAGKKRKLHCDENNEDNDRARKKQRLCNSNLSLFNSNSNHESKNDNINASLNTTHHTNMAFL